MRLLNTDSSGRLLFTEFPNEAVPPPYAILSHTWGKEEVLFEDVLDESYRRKLGFKKIQFCAEQARRDGLEYFWVDTCCINKANLTELSESLVLMFRWYQEAAKCYAYLADVLSSSKRPLDSDTQLWKSSFHASRWFTRGWTLQELLAPTSVEFFSEDGRRLGAKSELVPLLSEITSIPSSALQGTPLSKFTASERLQWAAARETTKPEDRAYSLLGVFQVSMTPNYGEGKRKAMVRLIEEFNKSQLHDLLIESHHEPESSYSLKSVDPISGLSILAEDDKLQDYKSMMLESLRFTQMDNRRQTIRSAYSKTCAWLPCHPAYMNWLDPQKHAHHNGFLWIKGKPGAGKSTLIKHAFEQSSKSPRNNKILLCFFFNARGDVLEKSTCGMYRSLLCQLLPRIDARRVFHGPIPDSWKIDQLRELLTSAVSQLQDFFIECFIDALDECDEQEIRDMIAHFQGLAQMSDGRLCVCLASRHYPTIIIPDGEGIELLLEHETGHHEDLAKYIRKHLHVGKGKTRTNLEQRVQLKANSVFMWAVLVIDILNDEFRRGSIFNVDRRLNEIPTDLSKLFEDILLRDGTRREHLLLCIQWVLFAKRPLKLEEFYFTMSAGLVGGSPKEWDPELTGLDDMKRYMSDSSKGLVELTKSSPPTVQFIHESVRDFLLKDGGLSKLWPDLGTDVQSLSHSQLSKCCQTSLNIDFTHYDISPEKPRASATDIKTFRATISRRLPFLEYAAYHVFYHADQNTDPVATDEFLTNINFRDWTLIYNSLEPRKNHRFTQSAPLDYICAAQNAGWLLRRLCQLSMTRSLPRNEYYGHPLLVAIAFKSWDAVQAILEPSGYPDLKNVVDAVKGHGDTSVGKDVSPLLWATRRGCVPLAEMLILSSFADPDLRDHSGDTALSLAAKNGLERIVHLLLGRNAADSSNKPAIWHAAKNGHSKVVQQLLDAGADVNAKGEVGAALEAASENGNSKVVQQLLDAGADKITDAEVSIALIDASRKGHSKVVQQLLDAGADVHTEGEVSIALRDASWNGHSKVVQQLLDAGADKITKGEVSIALGDASRKGHSEVVQQLLDAGADVNAKGGHYGTALQAASWSDSSKVVQQLLDAGADVNAKGGHFGTALQAASWHGSAKIVQQLLDAGADVNAREGNLGTALEAALERDYEEMAALLTYAKTVQ